MRGEGAERNELDAATTAAQLLRDASPTAVRWHRRARRSARRTNEDAFAGLSLTPWA